MMIEPRAGVERIVVPTDTAELLVRQGLTPATGTAALPTALPARHGPTPTTGTAALPAPHGPTPTTGTSTDAVADVRIELADKLRRAWIGAGKPSMAAVGDEVGYSKASISKVLAGKMAPSYRLIRKLGLVLGVPPETVEEWHKLWLAADAERNRPVGIAQRNTTPACPRCGCVINNHLVHEAWHATLDVGAPPSSTPDRVADSHEWASLRDALPRRGQ
jgi:transcriptional regulator with XRE-family HTH domain